MDRRNRSIHPKEWPAGGPSIRGMAVGVFYDLYLALAIGFSHKLKMPFGVIAHGLALAATVVLLILAYKS